MVTISGSAHAPAKINPMHLLNFNSIEPLVSLLFGETVKFLLVYNNIIGTVLRVTS